MIMKNNMTLICNQLTLHVHIIVGYSFIVILVAKCIIIIIMLLLDSSVKLDVRRSGICTRVRLK